MRSCYSRFFKVQGIGEWLVMDGEKTLPTTYPTEEMEEGAEAAADAALQWQ